jgi:hypothetical protein
LLLNSTRISPSACEITEILTSEELVFPRMIIVALSGAEPAKPSNDEAGPFATFSEAVMADTSSIPRGGIAHGPRVPIEEIPLVNCTVQVIFLSDRCPKDKEIFCA